MSNVVKFVKLDPRAVTPTKGTPLSVGYDLTAIDVHEKLTPSTTLYRTGIAVQPPHGYYNKIVPRSSISKTGYMLANSVGTIDEDYTGELYLALIKVDQSMPDLQMPFKICQLVFDKAEPCILQETVISDLQETERGSGGFGSTNNADPDNEILYSAK